MKYFLDTEFLEGPQTVRQWGLNTDTWLRIFAVLLLIPAFLFAAALPFTIFKVVLVLIFLLPGCFLFSLSMPKTPPTIDLISIGIVSELGQTFYAISKEFNVTEAWYRFDLVNEQQSGDARNLFPEGKTKKVYWIRENVLKPIWRQMFLWQHIEDANLSMEESHRYEHALNAGEYDFLFNLRSFKKLLKKYGKSNKIIADEIIRFVYPTAVYNHQDCKPNQIGTTNSTPPEFYAYYADYDWVAFCWLFGRMMDLPKGFPMYCRDLKQMLDEKAYKSLLAQGTTETMIHMVGIEGRLQRFKRMPEYPKQENEHHALADAQWNMKLYQFITSVSF